MPVLYVMGKPPRNVLLILNGIVENWLPWKMSRHRYVKIEMKNIFPPKPLINSKSQSNCTVHIKPFKCRYFNFCNYDIIQLNLKKCFKSGWKLKLQLLRNDSLNGCASSRWHNLLLRLAIIIPNSNYLSFQILTPFFHRVILRNCFDRFAKQNSWMLHVSQ